MDISELFEQVYAIYDGNDTPCEFGCSKDNLRDAIVASKARYPDKPYCVIEDWVWVDVDFCEARPQKFVELGIYPSFVRSSKMVDDEAQRPHLSDSVRSTALSEFHSNCVFVTRNSSYILLGPGSRVAIKPEVLASLQQW